MFVFSEEFKKNWGFSFRKVASTIHGADILLLTKPLYFRLNQLGFQEVQSLKTFGIKLIWSKSKMNIN